MADLEAVLRARRDGGGRALVPYVTGGFPGVDPPLLQALQDTGADAVEVGIPFSDPVMDGGVIQQASRVALERGAHPRTILDTIGEAALTIPVAVMTYVNPLYRYGFAAALDDMVDRGVAGAIVPDLPVDEAEGWLGACAEHGVASVLLAAPGSSDERLGTIAGAASGFVYCVATYGVTGARDELGQTGRDLVGRLRPLTDLPLLMGVGVGTPEQAADMGAFADGVIVGSALMGRLLEGDRDGLVRAVEGFRNALPTS